MTACQHRYVIMTTIILMCFNISTYLSKMSVLQYIFNKMCDNIFL